VTAAKKKKSREGDACPGLGEGSIMQTWVDFCQQSFLQGSTRNGFHTGKKRDGGESGTPTLETMKVFQSHKKKEQARGSRPPAPRREGLDSSGGGK